MKKYKKVPEKERSLERRRRGRKRHGHFQGSRGLQGMRGIAAAMIGRAALDWINQGPEAEKLATNKLPPKRKACKRCLRSVLCKWDVRLCRERECWVRDDAVEAAFPTEELIWEWLTYDQSTEIAWSLEECEECKKRLTCSVHPIVRETAGCGRYGLGFESLEEDVDTFWYSKWGHLIREALGIAFVDVDDVLDDDEWRTFKAKREKRLAEVRMMQRLTFSPGEASGGSRLLPKVKDEEEPDLEVPVEASRKW